MLPKTQIAYLTKKSLIILNSIIENEGYEAQISKKVLTQATSYFLRDIYRLDEQQRGAVSLAKFAGYWGFWIRKLKPISPGRLKDNPESEEYPELNELAAINFAVEIIQLLRQSERFEDFVWRECREDNAQSCNGIVCFSMHVSTFFKANEGFFLDYIKHSLRVRTFGPHHFSLVLEQLIYSSCIRSQFGQQERDLVNATQ